MKQEKINFSNLSLQNVDSINSIFYPLVLIDFKECKPFQTYCYANILGSVEGLSRDVSLVYIKNTKNCSICKCFGSLNRKSVWTFATSNNFEFLDMTDSTVYKLKKKYYKSSQVKSDFFMVLLLKIRKISSSSFFQVAKWVKNSENSANNSCTVSCDFVRLPQRLKKISILRKAPLDSIR